MNRVSIAIILVVGVLAVVHGRPQQGGGNQNNNKPEEKYPPMPYQYEYEVNDPPSKNYFGQEEAQNGQRTDGKYFVWLPDGRLMTVTYYVEGDSGFVPKITFSDPNFNPPPPTHQLGGSKQ